MKKRLDIILVEKDIFPSRHKAQAAIMSGKILVNGEKITKSGHPASLDSVIEYLENNNIYVSRGGLKLEKALNEFKVDVKGKLAADIGASTGGFTDCLLKKGASKVFAIDVGYGQFDYSLRNNPDVILLERTNIRELNLENIPFLSDLTVVDLSFISFDKVVDKILELSKDNAELIILIKPQFEAGKDKVGKGGIVRDRKVHLEVLKRFKKTCRINNLGFIEIIFSPIKGTKGNIEYLAHLIRNKKINEISENNLNNLIGEAFKELGE